MNFEEQTQKIVMVFGTFDVFHAGHEDFLNQAKTLGDYLIVVVARDATVKNVKGEYPEGNEKKRANAIRETELADKVVIGYNDDKYRVIKKYKPNVIALGYDQFVFTYKLNKMIIDENPGKDKGVSDFQTYIKHFDFNKLPKNILIGYKDMIEGMFVVNRDVKTKRYFRALLSYVSIDLLKIPLIFPVLKRHFSFFYVYLTHAGYVSAERDVIGRVLKKVGLLGFVRRFLTKGSSR